jgi:curved DNA-binding protein CbpA
MGALSNLWKNPFIDLKTKHSFFLAIPINLLLWGCESWALKESALKKLDAFLHRSIRRILGIKMSQVREERIRNEQVRKDFFDIPDIRKQIAARQLSFIGKTLRHPSPTHLPRQLITAWVNNKRPRGGVLTTNKKLILKALRLLYSSKSATDPFDGAPDRIDKKGSIGLWLEDTLNEKRWEWLIDCQLRKSHPKINSPDENRRSTNDERNNFRSNPAPTPPRRRQNQHHRSPLSPQNESYNEENVGRILRASYLCLSLSTNVSSREAKVRFRALLRIYHPDVHKMENTGLTDIQAKERFQLFNNAYEHIRSSLQE